MIKVVVPTATATFAARNETFFVSQTPSVFSSKVEAFLVVFLVRCYILYPVYVSAVH